MKDYKITKIFPSPTETIEFSVDINGYSYLVIYGKHINGGFCCVPNFKWGCEMATPEEIGYNSEKLMRCGASQEEAENIAFAISEVAKNV